MNIEKCPKCGWRHSAEECPPPARTGLLSTDKNLAENKCYTAAQLEAATGQQAEPTEDQVDRIVSEHIYKVSSLGEGNPVAKLNFYRDLVKAGHALAADKK